MRNFTFCSMNLLHGISSDQRLDNFLVCGDRAAGSRSQIPQGTWWPPTKISGGPDGSSHNRPISAAGGKAVVSQSRCLLRDQIFAAGEGNWFIIVRNRLDKRKKCVLIPTVKCILNCCNAVILQLVSDDVGRNSEFCGHFFRLLPRDHGSPDPCSQRRGRGQQFGSERAVSLLLLCVGVGNQCATPGRRHQELEKGPTEIEPFRRRACLAKNKCPTGHLISPHQGDEGHLATTKSCQC